MLLDVLREISPSRDSTAEFCATSKASRAGTRPPRTQAVDGLSIADGREDRRGPLGAETPPVTSAYRMWSDESFHPPMFAFQVGKTRLGYQLRCIEDLHAMLKEHDDWIELGAADEQKPAKDGTVEAWARAADNPVGGWYGSRKDSAAGSGRTCRRCWKRSASRSSNTSRATTGCAPAERAVGSSTRRPDPGSLGGWSGSRRCSAPGRNRTEVGPFPLRSTICGGPTRTRARAPRRRAPRP